jgi:hypothetical protein
MQEVEWDFDSGEPLAIRADEGAARATGVARDATHRIEWRPLVYDYPDDFDPRWPNLLGERSLYSYDETNDHVVITFPEANTGPDAVRGAIKAEMTNQAAQRLAPTDWVVLEALEEGGKPSKDVQELRKAIRDRLKTLHQEVDNLPVEALLDYSWTLDPHAPTVAP